MAPLTPDVRAQQHGAAAPLRIALLTGEYPPQPGGVGDYTCQLGHALGAEGHQVAAITIRDGRLIRHDLSVGEAEVVVSNPARSLTWSSRSCPAVRAAIQAWHPDWLHIQYQTGAYAMRAGVN
ncbi:MAG: glycosyltransferase, partial [Chloroflexales bacterium]